MTDHTGDAEEREALTPIHSPIHCAATDENLDGENELDQIAIDHFLETLSEIAMAIARKMELPGE